MCSIHNNHYTLSVLVSARVASKKAVCTLSTSSIQFASNASCTFVVVNLSISKCTHSNAHSQNPSLRPHLHLQAPIMLGREETTLKFTGNRRKTRSLSHAPAKKSPIVSNLRKCRLFRLANGWHGLSASAFRLMMQRVMQRFLSTTPCRVI